MERPRPVLGAQPPLPNDKPVAVRYAQGGEDVSEKALVPTVYYEEPPVSETNQTYYAYEEPAAPEQWTTETGNLTMGNEGKVSLDLPTLMFIAGQQGMARPRPTYPQRQYGTAPAPLKGLCYKCNGDHLIKDYRRTDIVRVNGFCTDCGQTHLIVDYPNHPDKRPATTLNVLSTIPSSGNEEELNVPAKVVTRAQRKA